MAHSDRWCNRAAWIAAGLGAALAAVACVLLAMRMLPLGIPRQWFWPLRQTPVHFGWPAALSAAVAVAAAAYVIRLLRLRSRVLPDQFVAGVLFCCLVAFGMMSGLLLAEDYPYLRTAQAACSALSLPYYGAAVAAPDARSLLADYTDPEYQRSVPQRVRTHPPGAVLYFLYARRAVLASPTLMEASHRLLAADGVLPADATLLSHGVSSVTLTGADVAAGLLAGLALTFVGVLAPAALFLVAWAIGDPRTGLLAALLAAAIPSLLLFVPSIDGLGVVMALSALAACLWALRRSSYALAVIGGLVCAAAFIWSIGLLALSLPLAAVLLSYLRDPQQRRAALLLALTIAGTFTAALVLLYLFTGYNAAVNTLQILHVQKQIMAGAGRDRLTWTFLNLYEFAVFLGPMLALTSLAGLACVLRRGGHAGYMGAGLLAALLILNASGSTRGEVGRIWVFFMPLFAVYAAHLRHFITQTSWRWYFPLLLAAQIAVTMFLFAYIIPVQP